MSINSAPTKVNREKKGLLIDIQRLIREPSLLLIILLIMSLFILFIIYPFIKLVSLPNINDWKTFFIDKTYLRAFRNTLVSALLATTTATILGFIFAYSMHYTDIPGKRFFKTIAIVPMMAPSVVTGLAFIILFGRRGLITYKLLNLKIEPYGPYGLWIVQTIAFFPLAYMTISGVLRAISPNVELAAENLGAKGFKLFRTITLKLATPGIVSAFLLVAINTFADFGNPRLIAGNYKLLATEAYVQMTGQFNPSLAAVLSVMLVLPTMLIFFLQNWYLKGKSYVTVTGKPVSGLNRNTTTKLAKWMLFAACCLISLVYIMIFIAIFAFAFTKNFGVDYSFTINNFMTGVFKEPAIKNSWMLSMATAIIATLLGVIIAFLVSRKNFIGKRIMDFLALIPMSLPGTFIGLSLILAFNKRPLMLTGTAAIIVIGMTLRQMPVGYRNAIAGFKQIDKSIEEASTNLGASSVSTFRRIVIPMLQSAFSTSLVYCFMKSMNTLSTVIFLMSPKWQLASLKILDKADNGYIGVASAVVIGMMAVIFLTFGIVKLIFKDKVKIFDL